MKIVIRLTLAGLCLLSASGAFGKMSREENTVVDNQSGLSGFLQQADLLEADMKALELLEDVLAITYRSYYKEIHFSSCIPALLKGGISECTDRYSYYVDPEEREKEYSSFVAGELCGIGAALELNESGGFKIINVFEQSPAEKAGLRPGDVIVAVSSAAVLSPKTWVDVREMALDIGIELIRGKKGTLVHLLIAREAKRKTVTLTRDVVTIPFIKARALHEKVGYLKITEFGGEVASQAFAAIEKLKSQGMQVLVIDLRNNPGGKLESVLEICSWFAHVGKNKNKVTPLFIKARDGFVKGETVAGSSVGKFQGTQLVILQNENSASASEILSGYLQSQSSATVVGVTSFGKGIVQSMIQLRNGGELHLTIAEYFIGPDLIKVHGIGIKPNIEVKDPPPGTPEAKDPQFQRALQEAQKMAQ